FSTTYRLLLLPKSAGEQPGKTVTHQTLVAELLHLLGDVGHVLVLLEEPVDLRDRGARAGCDAPAARTIEQLGIAPFAFGHRRDDRLLAFDDAFVDVGFAELLLELADPRQQSEHAAHPAHPPDLAQLSGEVVEVEPSLFELGGELFGLFLVDRLGRLLDQADDIAHAEDTPRDTLGMKLLERLDALAHSHQYDRLAGDRPHRQCRPAPRIAVNPGQHDRSDAGTLAKGLGDVDRVLPGHRIGDE